MSAHDQLELAEPYALGALDDDERRSFEAHLRDCSECQAAVASARIAVDSIGTAVAAVPLPAGAADRLLSRFRDENKQTLPPPAPQGGGLSTGLSILAIAAAAIGMSGWLGFQWNHEKTRADRLQDENEVLEMRGNALEKKTETLEQEKKDLKDKLDACEQRHAEGLTYLRLKKTKAGFAGTVQVALDEVTSKVSVFAAGLKPLAPGKVYKLWALVSGKPVPMPSLGDGGQGRILQTGDAPAGAKPGQFAISVEDDPNVTSPNMDTVQFLGSEG